MKILFKLSGSISCYKACQLISRLVKENHEVQTVATPSALKFIGTSTLEGLTGKAVLSESFKEGRQMAHIDLARWADMAILCPATAHIINALAHGVASGLLGDLFLAYEKEKPYFIVPAMNSKMWHHPCVQESIQTLEKWSVHILETQFGELACGEVGEGKLLEPDDIYEKIFNKK